MKPVTRKEAQKQLEFLTALKTLAGVLDGEVKEARQGAEGSSLTKNCPALAQAAGQRKDELVQKTSVNQAQPHEGWDEQQQ